MFSVGLDSAKGNVAGIVDEKIAKGGGPDITSVKKEQPEISQL